MQEVISLLRILGTLSLYFVRVHINSSLFIQVIYLHILYYLRVGKLLNDGSHTSSTFRATLHPVPQMLIE